jgi:hypothetical protein
VNPSSGGSFASRLCGPQPLLPPCEEPLPASDHRTCRADQCQGVEQDHRSRPDRQSTQDRRGGSDGGLVARNPPLWYRTRVVAANQPSSATTDSWKGHGLANGLGSATPDRSADTSEGCSSRQSGERDGEHHDERRLSTSSSTVEASQPFGIVSAAWGHTPSSWLVPEAG